MTIRFSAELTCDHHPRCTEKWSTRVLVEMDSGCSPFGGSVCKGELAADVFPESGWHELLKGDEWKVCCPKCWAEPDRFEPAAVAAKLRAYDWTPHCWSPGRGGMNPDIVPQLKRWTEQLLNEPDAWEATTDGGYPRCGWGKVCGFEMRASYGGRPCPHVFISGWAGGSWHSLSSVSEFRRRADDERAKAAP